MRVNMGREGRTSSSLSANGGSMLGALILANGPSQPLEAATKYYVDSTFASLNANNVLDGVLPISSLPGFTGDATSPQGSNVITLTNLGVTPGSYAKVIVDAKGRVTGNDILTESDIPVIGWDKVQNKPNTLEGYGITDALSVTGGVFGGQMSVIVPTNSMSAVNKQYVDAALSDNSAVVGDIIRKPYAATPVGFLRCNGAAVSKTTYADLYAVIGDNFAVNSDIGSGQPWRQQYQINTTQSSDINGWATGAALPSPITGTSIIVTKNRVYVLGGYNNVSYISTVYTASINDDGSLGTWTTSTSLPGVLSYSSAVVTKNRVYLLGGYNGTTCISTIYTAPINSDGTLGIWTTDVSLPGALGFSSVIITKKRIYLLGGSSTSTTVVSSVYTAIVNADGTLGTWSTDTSLLINLASSQAIVTKNRVYLIGGVTTGSVAISTVYTAPINSDGTLGTWTIGAPLPTTLASSQSIVTKNRVYIFGGSFVTTVYTAIVNADGTLGTWTTGTVLPSAIARTNSFITKNKIYLIGGHLTGSVAQSTVYTATINSSIQDYSPYYDLTVDNNYMMPGSGKPWQQQYQINQTQSADITGWSTTVTLPTVAGNSQVVVTKNRVYLIGGKDNSGYRNTVYYAPINSDGSLGSWFTDTVFPIAIAESQSVVTKNKVYLIGGRNSSGYLNVIYVAVINADGTLGTWNKHAEYVYNVLSGSGSFNISTGTTNITIHGKGGAGTTGTTGSVTWTNPEITWINPEMDPNGEYSNGTINPPSLTGYPPPSTIRASEGLLHSQMFLSTYNTTYAIYTDDDDVWELRYRYNAAPVTVTTGTNSTFTVNGVTYTSNGGIGGAAVQTTNNLTFPGTNPIPVSYNIASGGSGDISYWGGNYLPYTIGSSNIIVTRNRVYSIGGYVNGSVSSAVYSAPINSEGVIGAWVAGTSLPAAVAYSSIVVTNNRVYILGGSTNGSNSVNTVYTATINTTTGIIGSWVASTNLLTAVCKASVFTTKNKVYLIGGNTATNTAGSLVQMCTINADGTLGTWSVGTTIPGVLSESGLAITKNHIYLLNGSTGSTYTNTNYMAAVSDSLNDYSPYHDGTILPLDINYESSLFALPDFTSKEKNGVNFYIKF